MGLRHLCVVNDRFELLGIVTRKDLDHATHEHEHHSKSHNHGHNKGHDHADHDSEMHLTSHTNKTVAPTLHVPLLSEDEGND
jgi:CBS-domain-containing membrane protein